jgi:hypothetical protein
MLSTRTILFILLQFTILTVLNAEKRYTAQNGGSSNDNRGGERRDKSVAYFRTKCHSLTCFMIQVQMMVIYSYNDENDNNYDNKDDKKLKRTKKTCPYA